jgi:hypothetical protein
VHVPTLIPPPALPAVPEGQDAVPLSSARLTAHVLVYDDLPRALLEFEVLWPQDKGREFAFDVGKYTYAFQIDTVEACGKAPADPSVEISRIPYLHVVGECRVQDGGELRVARVGRYVGNPIEVFDTFHKSAHGGGPDAAMAIVLSRAAPQDPLQEISASEWIRTRWDRLRPRVMWWHSVSGLDTAALKKMGAWMRPWREIAGTNLKPPPTIEETTALEEKALASIGVRRGGLILLDRDQDAWVDLDSGAQFPVDNPSVWPMGIDLRYAEGRIRVDGPPRFERSNDVDRRGRAICRVAESPVADCVPGLGSGASAPGKARVSARSHDG